MERVKYELVTGYVKLAGYSLSDLAKRLGITRRTLANKINGYSDFTISEALTIKEIVGKPIDEIFLT